MVTPQDIVRQQSVAKYIQSVWGTKVKLVPLNAIAVLTTSTKLLNNNPRRFEIMIANQGTGTVYIDFGQAPATAQGIPLGPQGTLNLTAFEDGELVGYDVYAIAAAVGNTVNVWEIQAE